MLLTGQLDLSSFWPGFDADCLFLHSPHFASKAPNKAVGGLELKGHSLAARNIETRQTKDYSLMRIVNKIQHRTLRLCVEQI
jgi:hypothetical protein